jgi:hypothetical protein
MSAAVCPLPTAPLLTEMSQVWVHANRRPLVWGMAPPLLLTIAGMILLFVGSDRLWPRVLGGALVAAGAVLMLGLAWMCFRPRLALRNEHLLVYLRLGPPLRVPIQIVEGFLLGRAAAFLPSQSRSRAETSALVVRLAESAPQWSHVEVHPALGRWCDGYITIRGTWCEPLSVDFVNHLNARLAEAHGRSRVAAPS